jgi:hypothetical protein
LRAHGRCSSQPHVLWPQHDSVAPRRPHCEHAVSRPRRTAAARLTCGVGLGGRVARGEAAGGLGWRAGERALVAVVRRPQVPRSFRPGAAPAQAGAATHQAARGVDGDLGRPQRAVAVHPVEVAVLDLHGHEGPQPGVARAGAERAAALARVAAVGALEGGRGGCGGLLLDDGRRRRARRGRGRGRRGRRRRAAALPRRGRRAGRQPVEQRAARREAADEDLAAEHEGDLHRLAALVGAPLDHVRHARLRERRGDGLVQLHRAAARVAQPAARALQAGGARGRGGRRGERLLRRERGAARRRGARAAAAVGGAVAAAALSGTARRAAPLVA